MQADVNGIEMGVLENGISYLTQRGLSTVTGVTRRAIQTITQEWEDYYRDDIVGKDRISFFRERLFSNGYDEPKLYIETEKDGSKHYAHPDIVCMTFLRFHAYESKSQNQQARENYDRFALYGLQKFIYDALHYTPIDKWKYHNDRVSILKDSTPIGYFTVFHEIVGLVVDLIHANLTVNEKTIPDISVSLAWGKHWNDNGLDEQFGPRIEYKHNYPDYCPQAKSNPQAANAYPDEALAAFRKWFRETYLLTKFPVYILRKAEILPGGKQEATMIANMYKNKELPKPE